MPLDRGLTEMSGFMGGSREAEGPVTRKSRCFNEFPPSDRVGTCIAKVMIRKRRTRFYRPELVSFSSHHTGWVSKRCGTSFADQSANSYFSFLSLLCFGPSSSFA